MIHNRMQKIKILKKPSPIKYDFRLVIAEQMGGSIEFIDIVIDVKFVKLAH